MRWLWGAFELLRQHLADWLPTDGWQQIDTSALPVKHPSRVRTDLDSRLVRALGIVPAAVNERTVAEDLLDARPPDGLLLDRGFIGRAWAAVQAQRGTRVVVAHSRAHTFWAS